jgi:hypothetical protein
MIRKTVHEAAPFFNLFLFYRLLCSLMSSYVVVILRRSHYFVHSLYIRACGYIDVVLVDKRKLACAD